MRHDFRVLAGAFVCLLTLLPAACSSIPHLAMPVTEDTPPVETPAPPAATFSDAARSMAITADTGTPSTYASAEDAIRAGDTAGLLTFLSALPEEERSTDNFANAYLALDRAADGDFAGAAALFGERFSGDVPDGLAILLAWQVYRRIDADGADGLADILDAWRHRMALRSAWFPKDEKSAAYALRLRSTPSGRSVRLAAVDTGDDAEAEYLLQARVRRGLILVPESAATPLLRGGHADPTPLRRAAWAALSARERWEMPG
jgi:hypothetical protein